MNYVRTSILGSSAAICAIVLLGCCALAPASEGAHSNPLILETHIPLPGMRDGDFDHFAADIAGHRLFLAAEANGVVLVFDSQRNKAMATIHGFKEPHAVLFREDLRQLYVVDGEDSAVEVLDANNYRSIAKVSLSIDADSMAYDAASGRMYVVNGGREAKTGYCLISVIDTSAGRKTSDLEIDDTNWLEGMALEHSGTRLFVSLTGAGAIGVIDRQKKALIRKWELPPNAQQNVPLKLDETNHRLFTVTRKPPAFYVMDSDDGRVISSLPCPSMVDDIAFDTASRRIYLPGDQTIAVIQQKDPDHYSRIATYAGGFRAKTAILVPQWHRFYLAVPRHANHEAEVRVFKVAQ